MADDPIRTVNQRSRPRAGAEVDPPPAAPRLPGPPAGALPGLVAEQLPTVFQRGGSRPAASAAPAATAAGSGDLRYTLGEEIARGGMGRVVDATDTVLGRAVALKEALTSDREVLRRFARETRITARLEHPSIVPVYDAGTSADGAPFYVMRKVGGRPLEDLVVDATTLDQRLALLPHMVATAQAIAHAHRRGVLHRDLKPTNILVGDLGETVVIDWGLAKVIGEPDADEPVTSPPMSAGDSLRTRVGTVFGTPGFMAPEQLRGDPVDPRSDVYALGASLYFLLARRPPHSHATVSGDAMMIAALAGPPVPIATLVPGLPPELSTIVDKALAYEAEDRYPDAGAIAEELQRFLTGQLVASHRYSRRERLRRLLRRHRVAFAVAALAVIALAVIGALSISGIVRARNRAEHERSRAESERGRADIALRDALARNEELVLQQAQGLLLTNPTAAVALVKPLPASRWRDVRAIGTAARARGTAWGYPVSAQTVGLAMSADGTLAMTAGLDGTIRTHDVRSHATRVLAELGQQHDATLTRDGRQVVAWRKRSLVILDVASGARRAIDLEVEAQDVKVTGRTAWVLTGPLGAGALWSVGLDSGPPRPVPVDDTIASIEASPDGRWLAALGSAQLWLAQPGAAPRPLPVPGGSAVAWHPAGTLVAVAARADVAEIALGADTGAIVRRHALAAGAFTYDAQGLVLGSSTGAELLWPPVGAATLRRRPVPDMIRQLDPGPEGTLLALSFGNRLFVVTKRGVHALGLPSTSVSQLAVHATSGVVLVATRGVLLQFDLRQVLPARIPIPPASNRLIAPAADQLIAMFTGEPALWVDHRHGDQVRVDLLDPTALVLTGRIPDVVVTAPRGEIVGVNPPRGLFLRGVPEPFAIGDDLASSTFVGPDLVVASVGGQLRRYPPPYTRADILAEVGANPTLLAARRDGNLRLAGALAGGRLWRLEGTPGRVTTLDRGSELSGLVITDDAVVFTEGARVMVWHPDGRVSLHSELPRPIAFVANLGHGYALVGTDDAAGYVIELARPGSATSRLIPGTRLAAIDETSGLVAVERGGDAITLIDPVTDVRWDMVAPDGVRGFLIAPGGERMYTLTGEGVSMWTTEVPATPAETAAFLERLTNAHAPAGPAALTWD